MSIKHFRLNFSEKKETATILLQNAEISQELSILKQELKNETAEATELNESNQKLQQSLNEWWAIISLNCLQRCLKFHWKQFSFSNLLILENLLTLWFRSSETELNALRSKNVQLEMIAKEQKSKTEIIDELNKEIAEKNKVCKAVPVMSPIFVSAIYRLSNFSP